MTSPEHRRLALPAPTKRNASAAWQEIFCSYRRNFRVLPTLDHKKLVGKLVAVVYCQLDVAGDDGVDWIVDCTANRPKGGGKTSIS
jgi:hypothetical protein